eukprot:351773-Alexandrium_andersonii.AAC.1
MPSTFASSSTGSWPQPLQRRGHPNATWQPCRAQRAAKRWKRRTMSSEASRSPEPGARVLVHAPAHCPLAGIAVEARP